MKFPIPSSFPDLEREPYNLLPYPIDFDEEDEATRADSFARLCNLLEQGNRELEADGILLFESIDPSEDDRPCWCNIERIQALYTLVRKSSSLAAKTRNKVVKYICDATDQLCLTLSTSNIETSSESKFENEENSQQINLSQSSAFVMPQSFRDAFACHLYMLYSIMFLHESEAKHGKKLSTSPKRKGKGKSKKNSSKNNESVDLANMRTQCAKSMLTAAEAMGEYKSKLWVRGVPDEDVVSLPCRIAYQILENSNGTVAKKAASGDLAVKMIAAAIDSTDNLMSTVVAALVDLLHSYEHMAQLTVEICCEVSQTPTNKLAIELLREIGRLDNQTYESDAAGKASGIKNVVPFISELAQKKPWIVLANLSILLPLLNYEPYQLRSSIVIAAGHILVSFSKVDLHSKENIQEEKNENEESKELLPRLPHSKRDRDSVISILCERIYDKSSYTRSTTLKTWANLVECHAIPADKYLTVTGLAIDRLQDKAVIVRRSSMQLLTLLLENNPFGGDLDPIPFFKGIEKLEKFVMSNLPLKFEEALTKMNEAEIDEDEKKANIEATKLAIINEEFLEDDIALEKKEIEYLSRVRALKFTMSAVEFIQLFEDSNDVFQSMLRSVNVSDVTEVLRFLVRARHFQLPLAVIGMKQALSLMWSSEKNVREEVMKAFIEVFVAEPGTEAKKLLPEKQIAQNLLVIAGDATPSEIASIEQAVKILVSQELIPSEVFLILWNIASTAPAKHRSTALKLLSMGASADTNIINSSSKLRLLYEAAFSEYIEEHRDWEIVASAALVLQKMNRSAYAPGSAKAIVIELIQEQIKIVVQGSWCRDESDDDTKRWFSAAENAINALFQISKEPEIICKDIIHGLEASTFGACLDTPKSSCNVSKLCRLFFVVGHIALKLLIYTEELSSIQRRCQASKTLSIQAEASGAKEEKKEDIEAQLGVAEEAAIENEQRLTEITEKEIIARGLIGLFGPILVNVVANEKLLFSSKTLGQSATMCLCKFMCVSEAYCEKHLPLLFDVLAQSASKDTSIQSNIVIALGDLAFRFPNAVEPYTAKIYACLNDSSTQVRKNTLMVLMHLILNDMVKVKGQVCEIALCLEDDESSIRDMSRLLFKELSKRANNPVCNLLPDIISNLSQQNIDKKNFRNIMTFLLNFIQKERQNETLIEKLCLRFPTCSSLSQKGDVAFCLTQLKISVKSIQTLNDLFKNYQDALFDEDIFGCFADILLKIKKNYVNSSSKQETLDLIEELEKKITNANAAGMENHIAGNKAKKAKAKAARRVARKKQKNRKALSEIQNADEDEDYEE